MHTRRLNRIASFLGSAGLYKEAYQIKKIAQSKFPERDDAPYFDPETDADRDDMDLAQEGFEDLFPTSPDDEDMDDMGEDEDDMDSSLSEYLDEEGMEPAGEERFDDLDFDPDMEGYKSVPHDDDDEEFSDEEFSDEDEDEDDMFDDEDHPMNDPDWLMRKFPKK